MGFVMGFYITVTDPITAMGVAYTVGQKVVFHLELPKHLFVPKITVHFFYFEMQ